MVQNSSSGDAGMTFAAAIKAAAERTRTGTHPAPAASEVIEQLTGNKGRFGVPPKALTDLMPEEQGDSPERPREE